VENIGSWLNWVQLFVLPVVIWMARVVQASFRETRDAIGDIRADITALTTRLDRAMPVEGLIRDQIKDHETRIRELEAKK